MKKLFIAILFSAVLFIGLPFYNVNAMSITYDVPFSSVPDTLGLLEDILNGGKINIKDFTTVDAVLEHYRETVGAKNFLSRQANILSAKLSKMAIDGELTINPSNNLVIPITISDLAYRMGYNPYWYEQYSPGSVLYPQLDTTINLGHVTFGRNTYNFSSIGYGNYSASINGVTYNDLYYPFAVRLHIGSNYYYYICGNSLSPGNNNKYDSAGFWDGVSDPAYYPDFSNFTYPYFLDITDAIAFARTGVIFDDDYFIGAPDVIQVGDTPEWTYDVFFPKVEGLEGLSINQFLEWLQEQIDDSTVDFIDLGMLIADEVPLLVIDDDADADTTPTVAPIITTVPVIEIIDPNDDPENTPTPSPYPLPPIPKFNFDNIPNEVDHTVLAEIIDSTQQVIPDELMYLIWSTFGLLVVGGLIYILHK